MFLLGGNPIGHPDYYERIRMDTQEAASLSREEQLYRSLTPTSYEYFLEGCKCLPGGDSRSPLFHPPYPVVLEEGDGCWLFDVDGNRLLDFTGNHTSLILGYRHPRVLDAVTRQLEKGTAFPGATVPQVRLAESLCERVPSFERVRFTNSGTEATMNAIRAARAFTRRHKIAKIEGGYNGSWDDVMVSTHPSGEQAGDALRPVAAPGSQGLTPDSIDNVVVLPFNEVEAAEQLIEQQGEHLAAIIVEPVMGSAGMIPAEQSYLEMLREVTERLGVLLVFDEVISFRVAYGGAQEHYRVSPDLTCLGKLIGGGVRPLPRQATDSPSWEPQRQPYQSGGRRDHPQVAHGQSNPASEPSGRVPATADTHGFRRRRSSCTSDRPRFAFRDPPNFPIGQELP